MKPVVLDPEARDEIKQAELHYEQQRDGLGRRFHDALYATLARIEESPEIAPLLGRSSSGHMVRAARVWRFPYRVIYAELPQQHRVMAVAHMKRRPGYWRDRSP